MPEAAKRHGHTEGKRKESRPSAYRRKYDAAWNAFRDWFLARHPECADCGALESEGGRDLQVHHIKKVRDRPDLRLVEDNCMSLCGSCHSKRTARGE